MFNEYVTKYNNNNNDNNLNFMKCIVAVRVTLIYVHKKGIGYHSREIRFQALKQCIHMFPQTAPQETKLPRELPGLGLSLLYGAPIDFGSSAYVQYMH